jgi:hypothetical protein
MITMKQINKIMELKNDIDFLYSQLDDYIEELILRDGDGEHGVKNPEGGFYKLVLVDNLKNMEECKPIYKTTAVKRYEVQIRELKNKPDCMEEK